MLRGKKGKPFWLSSLGQLVQFDTINFRRTFKNYFGQFVWSEKRVTLIVSFHFMKCRPKKGFSSVFDHSLFVVSSSRVGLITGKFCSFVLYKEGLSTGEAIDAISLKVKRPASCFTFAGQNYQKLLYYVLFGNISIIRYIIFVKVNTEIT